MKVTLIGTLPPIKGISPYCLELLKSLSKKTEVEFIGFRKIYPDILYPGGTKVEDENYEVSEIKNTEIKSILTYYNPFSWIWGGLTLTGDIIHVQWWSHVLAPTYLVILLICKMRKKKIVVTVHNVIPHESSKLNDFLNKSVLFFGDRFIVHNKKNKKKLSEIYGIPGDRISVISHGILTPVPVKGISKKEAREYLKIPQSGKIILCFGNIRDYKGLGVLLESLKSLVKEIGNVTLLIAGKPWSGWEKYRENIKENDLEAYVIKRLEFILPSAVEYYFSASDIVVLPYTHLDSQSGVAALALPFGKPLLVTDVGGLADFVKDEGAVAKPGDSRDLAEKIMGVFRDEKLLDKLSRDSKELARVYGWDEISKETFGLYRELM